MDRSVNVFCSYAERDQRFQIALEIHMSVLKRNGLITSWNKQMILPGDNRDSEINRHLAKAQIILLLVSPDFLDSSYCYDVEFKQALSYHKAGLVHIIPIILRHADWQNTPLGALEVLPRNEKPITSWRGYDRDKAFLSIVTGIRKVIEVKWPILADNDDDFDDWGTPGIRPHLRPLIDKCIALTLTERGNSLFDQKEYGSALEAFDQALENDRTYPFAYSSRAETLYALIRYEEALYAYEKALLFGAYTAYLGKGKTLAKLHRYEEALFAYGKAIEFDAENYEVYIAIGDVLELLGRHVEALKLYEKARNLSSGG